MSLIRKVWAALVALFLLSPKVGSVPVEAAPVVTPVAQPEKVEIPTVSILPPVDAEAGLPDVCAAFDPGPNLAFAAGSPLKALIDQLEKAFPAPSIKPGSDMASLQYAAGCRAVVEWVKLKQKRGQA